MNTQYFVMSAKGNYYTKPVTKSYLRALGLEVNSDYEIMKNEKHVGRAFKSLLALKTQVKRLKDQYDIESVEKEHI